MASGFARGGTWKIEIVKRRDAHRFVVPPKRWVVGRGFAGISRNRRLRSARHDPHHVSTLDGTKTLLMEPSGSAPGGIALSCLHFLRSIAVIFTIFYDHST